MTIEWLRRHDPVLDRHLRTYLFTEGDIVGTEQAAEHGGGGSGDAGGGAGDGSLGIGSLKAGTL
jgi:hypothetical protein